jgi:nuclear pore complex protein Nup155
VLVNSCCLVDGLAYGVYGDLTACRPVNPHPEPQWSGAHRGLALYVSRLLAPVWDVKVITPSSNSASVWKARLTEQTMSVSGCCC